MIEQTGSRLKVEDLMVRVRAEAAAMRQTLERGESVESSSMSFDSRLAYEPRWVQPARISELLDDAERNGKPRSELPKRFGRAPWSLFAPLFRFLMRINNYALKDQRHVNVAMELATRQLAADQAQRDVELRRLLKVADDRTQLLAQQFTQIALEFRDLEDRTTRSVDDRGSTDLDARLAPLETLLSAATRVDRELRRVDGELLRSGDRSDALEQAATISAARIDALERAMTTTAQRIDVLENEKASIRAVSTALTQRIDAFDAAAPFYRLATLEGMAPAARLIALENAMTQNASRLDRIEHLGLTDRLPGIKNELSELREHMLRADASIRADLSAQQVLATALVSSQPAKTEATPANDVPAKAYDHVLLELADRFRGDPVTIADRYNKYVDIVRSFDCVDVDHPLVDIGAGRGEWLRLLQENDVPSHGIEHSESLVERAREAGLDVRSGDAVVRLRSYGPGECGAITAFHVVEHLSFETFVDFIDEALRVLRPNGLFVFETPNPQNVIIGACNFWLDPTHVRPIPPALATFLTEQRGFTDVRVMLLTPNPEAAIPEVDATSRRLNEVMYGSQEYAIVARRPG